MDADVRVMQPGDHRKLYNGIQVQPQSSSVALDGIIASMFGNALAANSDLAGGTNKIIGGVEDRAYNRYFFCVYNSTAANNTVYQYKDAVITRVMRSALFDFAETDFVDMDILYDYLIMTNNRSDIKMINVTKAIAGATYTPAAEEITLIKRPPKRPLTLTPTYDLTVLGNFVAGNYFQFFHRFIYEDGQRSVFGPASKLSDAWVLPSTTVDVVGLSATNYSLTGIAAIDNFAITAGVTRILIKNQTSAAENGIYVAAAGAWTRATDADSDTELMALAGIYVKFGRLGGTTLYKNTNSSAFTVGTDPVYFQPIDGPNAIDVVTNTAEFPATAKQIEYAVRINGTNEFIVYRIDKIPLVSATHRFYNNTFLFTVPDSETFKWSDSVPVKSRAIRFTNGRIFLFNNTEGYTHATTTNLSLSLGTIAFTDTKAFRNFKDGGTYNVGIVFFDTSNRFVGGLHCDATITIPYRSAPSTDAPYKIIADLSGIAQADIPLDAVEYAVLVTNLIDKSFFINYKTTDFFYYIEASDGTITYTKTYTAANIKGTAIDITTLTNEGLGYTFSKGDRIRISNSTSEPVIVDTEILGQDGRFILTRTLNEFGSLLFGLSANSFNMEIYSPKDNTIEPFYEVGEKYAITSPGGGARAFSTVSIEPVGDVSTIYRNTYTSSGAYLPNNPFSNTYSKGVKEAFQAMNSYDKSFDTWVRPGGKSTIKSQYSAEQQTKKTSLRFGQEYDQLSQILQINTFQALDEQALYPENGPGVGLAVAGNVLVAIHEIETTAVYIGQGFVLTKDGSSFLSKTDSVIGDTNKYLGGHGSIHQASIIARDGVVYYLDARKGCVVRRSQDGLTPISNNGIKGLISTLCTTHLALGANSRIIGGWDPQYQCYVLSFIDTTGPSGYTLYWHEKSNAWCCLNDMRPEFWGQLGQNQLAFLSGGLWAQTVEANYNNFFGVQYNRRLEFEIGADSLEKIWEAIEVDAENIYSTAGANEDIVLLYHVNGGTLQNRINYLDFKLRGSAWRSSVFGNLNDANYSTSTESKYKSRHNTRGQSAFFVITYNGTDRNQMKSISVFFRPSLNSTP